jgi:uncharacterized protein YciI
MSLDDLSAGDRRDAVLYVLFLAVIPGKALTPTVIDQHTAHLADLDRKGQLVLAGPLLARFNGMAILRVQSLDEAKAIAEADPMVRGGFQSYELATWILANKQNHFRPTPPQAKKQ